MVCSLVRRTDLPVQIDTTNENMKRSKRMSRGRKRNDWIPGAVITIIVMVLSVVFVGLLAMTKMIPDDLYVDSRHYACSDCSHYLAAGMAYQT